jgi:hypothetical protein
MRSHRMHSLAVTRAAAGSLLLLLLAGCGNRTDDEVGAEAYDMPATEMQPTQRRDVTAELVSFDEDSPLGGSLYIDGTGDRPVVSVSLRGAIEGVHQGHIHAGTCENPGGVVAALEPIDANANGNGESITAVDIPLDTMTDGRHVVMYHAAGGSPGEPVICGQIPALHGES